MIKKKELLKTEIQFTQKQLKSLPAGELICSRNGKYYKWFHAKKEGYDYIPKRHRVFAEELALKKYLELHLEDCIKELKAVEQFLKKSVGDNSQAIKLLSDHSEIHNLLKSYLAPLSEELSNWQNEQYEKSSLHPEQLIHTTLSGNIVRSKSEALIDMNLYFHKLPFRYENPLEISGNIVYPDFTIRHPKTGDYYYWEHFGLMDNMEYRKKVGFKLQNYSWVGILPGVNLITTYEDSENPLPVQMIEKNIRHYFGDV